MSKLSDKLKEYAEPGRTGSDTRSHKQPEEWRPRMDIDMQKGGYVVSNPRPNGNTPSAEEVLADFGLKSEDWIVTGLRRSTWQTYNGDYLESCRISVVPVEAQNVLLDYDLERLMDSIVKWRPLKGSKQETGEGSFLVAPSDQQIGKKANGEGTPEAINKILTLTEGSVHRLQELRKIGRSLGTITFALLGDHVEGNVSQGGRLQSPAASDLGLTEQTRVARRLLLAQIKAFAPLCERMVIAVINGNHDEVTRQVVADPSDGWNVEIASAVQDICAENENLAHVEFRFPQKDHQTLAVDVCGTIIGLFHGHQAGKDVVKYLSGQAAGQTPLGMADLWLSGHYHHFKALEVGHRLWVQAPTTDPGSPWWRDRAGLDSPSGLLTMTIGSDFDPKRDISVVTMPK
jgi:predicted phosphodiesterase